MSISNVAPKTDRVALAVSVMVVTDLTLSIADAIIKVTIADMPLSQFIVLRSCITLPMLIILLKWRFPQISLRPVHLRWSVLRSALLLSSLLLYYASLPHLDLSMAAAVYYTIPLFVTLFSAVWIRERVGAKGWLGVALGFGGVLLMLKPQAGDLTMHTLMPLAAAILYAIAMVLTRTRNRGENPFVLALLFNLLALVLGSIAGFANLWNGEAGAVAGNWLSVRDIPWPLILLLSMTMLIGSVGTAVAYQLGPPVLISTWDFSYLAFAVVWGVVFFSERLDAASIVGIVLIPLAGFIVLRR
jgi:drug/metabolite transporter (DMT)-like permease